METNEIDKWTNLEEILEQIWVMLTRGVTDAIDPFHTPVLGSTDLNGYCNLRTVVLRQLMLPERRLFCHTDRRSSKVREIEYQPVVSWHFYHPRQKTQLRLTGPATLHADDDLANRQWAETRLMSRRSYCLIEPPGTPKAQPTSGLPDNLETRPPTEVESEMGRQNFMVIACRIDSIDWLQLESTGHRRARFAWTNDQLSATWLVP